MLLSAGSTQLNLLDFCNIYDFNHVASKKVTCEPTVTVKRLTIPVGSLAKCSPCNTAKEMSSGRGISGSQEVIFVRHALVKN